MARIDLDCSEEQQPLEDFFKSKNLKVRNEMSEDNVSSLVLGSRRSRLTCYADRHTCKGTKGSGH